MAQYQVINEFVDKDTGERHKVDRPAEIKSEARAKELRDKSLIGDKVTAKGGQQDGAKKSGKAAKGGQQDGEQSE